ncbi:SusC/RagA family TonB-linked outer membrane protein [Solitalea lacus]|uniref:SusC/RagA family TonB-linked outer membrane protein n=1 Tax=Solitalea lacus TaxID=2911172 RepID=UPI001EDC411A|nr:SusC/RagA family TonB-linked outer membrane protein [Solitalea lacus]UKJ07695.1 SusC/RagA family TonB-linked outer membrane protein [Solitalea lacus]
MKKRLLYLMAVLLLVNTALAQNRTITGTVTDKADGGPIPGVSVIVKGTSVGAQTNVEGKYSIAVQQGAILVFKFVGYTTKEVTVGTSSTVNVSLDQDNKQLGEVVVTALGIKRAEKSLGYSATTLKSDEITAARNQTVMSGLTGKVAGVAVSNAGGPGGSTKVIIRGVSSFTGGNQPLYIVDGVPINNGFKGNKTDDASVDFGNQANDINPDDVETVTVLKGASATALYGSRAAHGVIMITTKSAKQNQKLSISYSGSFNASNILRTPQTQKVFGQGWGTFAFEENGNWGPKYDGKVREWGTEVDGKRQTRPFTYVKDNVRNFYEAGNEYTNSLSVSGGSEHSAFVFSYANSKQNGVAPGDADNLNRNNFSFRGTTRYDKFSADYAVNYVRRDMSAIPAGQGTSDGGATLYQEIIQIPGSIDIALLKDYNNKYNNSDNYFTAYAQNPYFVLNENGNKFQDDRVFGKVELTYALTKQLKAVGRVGTDFSNSTIKNWGAIVNYSPGSLSEVYHKQAIAGRYAENYTKNNQLDANLFLQGDYKLSADLTLNAIVGYNYNQRTTTFLDSYVSGLNVANWYNLNNSNDLPVTESELSRRRLMAAYGQLEFGFKDYLFTNVSLRNDWSSTLPKGKNSFFYGGINSSVIVTEMFKELQSEQLNFLKVRAAWGQTGNDADVYRTNNRYDPTQIAIGFGNLYLPLGGVAGLTEFNTLGNQNLRPEITTEWELGTDVRLFSNRVGLDFAYYNRLTKDQIVSANLSPETGYTRQTLNIGNIANRGIEARLSIIPVKTSNFQWEFATNFTKNYSEVKSLYNGADEFQLYNAYSVNYIAKVGEPVGVFTVPQAEFVKEGPHKGKMIVQANGRPKIDANGLKTVGTSAADFVMGFTNSFKYKNFSLSAAIDWRQGGKFYSYTSQLSNFVGASTETTFNDRQPFMVPNSVKEVKLIDGSTGYVENNIPITFTGNYQYWYTNDNPAMFENTVLDKTNIKLREVVFSYSLPKKWLSGTPVGGVDLSVIGRNLLMWTPSSNNFVDPENTNYGNDITSEFGEFASGPSMRTFGASVKVTF